MVHTRWSNMMEYYSAIKRNIYIVLAFTVPFVATRMDLDIVTLSEVSQTEKDKYMILLICGILKKGTNEFIYKAKIESQIQKTNFPPFPKGEKRVGRD